VGFEFAEVITELGEGVVCDAELETGEDGFVDLAGTPSPELGAVDLRSLAQRSSLSRLSDAHTEGERMFRLTQSLTSHPVWTDKTRFII